MAFCTPLPTSRLPHTIGRRKVLHTTGATKAKIFIRRVKPTATILDIPLLTVPMTSGGDVLFPGSSQQIPLTDTSAEHLLQTACKDEPPQFAHLVINAWNEPGTVGTIATVDQLSTSSNALHCTGVSRFRVIHLAADYSSVRAEPFQDDSPLEEEKDNLEALEKELLQTLASVVNLSIKIASGEKQRALAETLHRVEGFCNMEGGERHWIHDLAPNRRRELLGFIVIDLLSISFMDRREILAGTNTAERLNHARSCLQPLVNDLAAKGAIVSALGRDETAN